MAFLRQEFPQLKTVTIPGYTITYDKKGSSLKLFYESVQFFNFIKKEHSFIDDIIDNHEIDMIVSDNRYGLWSKRVKSIIITHQLYVKAPMGESIAHKKIKNLISDFDECWIPDVGGEQNLSGDLSHLKPFNYPHKFIGPLSRFLGLESGKSEIKEYEIIAILSGPEPQRTIFEDLVLDQIERNDLKGIVVRGLPNEAKKLIIDNPNIQTFNHLPTEELLSYINKSKVVVCRAGYSSIMDLAILRNKAILVPTPKQTEQEYLAKYHLEKGNFYSQKQSEFDLERGLVDVNNFVNFLSINLESPPQNLKKDIV